MNASDVNLDGLVVGIATGKFTLFILPSRAAVLEGVDDAGIFKVPADCAVDADAITTQETRIKMRIRTDFSSII